MLIYLIRLKRRTLWLCWRASPTKKQDELYDQLWDHLLIQKLNAVYHSSNSNSSRRRLQIRCWVAAPSMVLGQVRRFWGWSPLKPKDIYFSMPKGGRNLAHCPGFPVHGLEIGDFLIREYSFALSLTANCDLYVVTGYSYIWQDRFMCTSVQYPSKSAPADNRYTW